MADEQRMLRRKAYLQPDLFTVLWPISVVDSSLCMWENVSRVRQQERGRGRPFGIFGLGSTRAKRQAPQIKLN